MPSLKRVGGHDIAFSFIFALFSNTPNFQIRSVSSFRPQTYERHRITRRKIYWYNEVCCIRRIIRTLLTYSCESPKRDIFIIIQYSLRLESVM